jgi:AAA+ ATPase superfamily predicted ATPase
MEKLIGRHTEQKLLQEAMDSGSSELIALFGRRRVGKTFLVKQYFGDNLAFEFVGTREAKLAAQLANFSKALGKAAGNPRLYRVPENWSDAFDQLTNFLTPILTVKRTAVFLDEFPWLNTHKSGFLPAFDHWWNSWGNNQANLVVVICGSAASWMIENIVNNKGGLHNRITRKIRLLPFNLKETEEFLRKKNINMDRYQILQLYMIMGGVPHYLKEIRKGESAAQAVNRVCFTKDGLLQGEFKNLYHSLFDDAARHLAVVKALAKNNSGLTRNDIIDKVGLTSGGTITELLEELIESGFVMAWQPYDKKSRDTIYKLSDEFTHFYLKFMENNRASGDNIWQSFSSGQSWKSWSGVAFERLCLKHISQIKKELGILNLYTEEATWRFLPKRGKGAQIDLLFDRKDFVINLCEMKYSENEFAIDKAYAGELENKKEVFKQQTKTKKSLFITFVTTFGLKDNEYAKRLIQNSIIADALFE